MSNFDLIRNWGEDRNLIKGSDNHAQFAKLLEETTELYEAIRKRDNIEFIDAIGDCVVVLTLIAWQKGICIEDCIDAAYAQIKDRKGKMINGVFVKDAV